MLKFTPRFFSNEEEKSYQRYMEKSASILTNIQQGIDDYQKDLGWITVEKWGSRKILNQLEEIAKEIRTKAEVFILIGVGGSNNAARSVIKAIQDWDDSIEIIYSGNTLSSVQMNKILHRIKGKSVYLNCIAKNFETLEPGTSFRVLRQFLETTYGIEEAGKRIICTGTSGSPFDAFCQTAGYCFLEFPVDIGGRYTAITSVGLLPMAVAGIDIREVVRGAKVMQKELHQKDFSENKAYQYACYRHFWEKKDYRIEMLASFEPQFRYFYKWWIQLFAESEGKKGQGLYPTCAEYSEDLHAVGQYVQEGMPQLIETFIVSEKSQENTNFIPDRQTDGFEYLDYKDFNTMNQIAYEATLSAHSSRVPCSEISIDRMDAYHFGVLFYFFQYACYLSCCMGGVNPFDQPGVEAYKRVMFKALKKNKL